MIKSIVEAVTIPVMAKVRIGHFVEAQVRHHHFISLIPAQARMYLARTRTHMQKKKIGDVRVYRSSKPSA